MTPGAVTSASVLHLPFLGQAPSDGASVCGAEENALTTLMWDEGIFATGELFVINVCYVVLIIL